MPLPPEIANWIARAEIDHLGPYVSAWAAFNAWYRHTTGETQDRKALIAIRTLPNSVRSAIVPYLDPQTVDTPAAVDFKQQIAALHGALEAHRLESTHKGRVEHVSFRSVPLRDPHAPPHGRIYSGINYRVAKSGSDFVSTISNRAGIETLRIVQPSYDLAGLMAHPHFQALPGTGRAQMRAVYAECDIRPMCNLLVGTEQSIVAGTINFPCTPDDLFGGVILTIYRMRNMLLHGELSPQPAALACYGPAYQLLRTMLRHCT